MLVRLNEFYGCVELYENLLQDLMHYTLAMHRIMRISFMLVRLN